MRSAFAALVLAGFLCGCSVPPSHAESPYPLGIGVTAWAAYEDGGETYIHLWAPGTPKSVYVLRESEAPAGFLEHLREHLPQPFPPVHVSVRLAEQLHEEPTEVAALELSSTD